MSDAAPARTFSTRLALCLAIVERLRVAAPSAVKSAQIEREIHVSTRTMRRYVSAIREAGIPVASGPNGLRYLSTPPLGGESETK